MIRVGVVGVGAFGQNHLRVIRESARAELAGVLDIDTTKAEATGARVFRSLDDMAANVDAAIVASPTTTHADVGCALLNAGIDVMVEKPIAPTLAEAERLVAAAGTGRILQVGHLERFNPAVLAMRKHVTTPLFFEIHRMSLFTPRSLDVDVVLDLMIHDIDLVLDMVGQEPEEIRAAGIAILSKKVDIANVRLAFPSGCVANLTASRVSTEKVRKVRLFQPHQYISIDYARQDGVLISVSPTQQIGFNQLAAPKVEPLKAQFESFLDSIETRNKPLVGGVEATGALRVAVDILAKIEEHAQVVARTLSDEAGGNTHGN
ncbi:MAG: Gfo/Idh/MocA family oxidoreductase [Bryobacterales bacterium]|nr:Gfo/Idh/MocA family oxidoreductase [Bryobacterales bacterium]